MRSNYDGMNTCSASILYHPLIFQRNQQINMADGGFDPCECIFNHEMAMRRLLSLLRSSQTYCTDNECLQDGLPGPGQTDGTSDNFMMMMIGWMLMAAVMFFLRPNSMRNNSTEGKPSGVISKVKKMIFFLKLFFPFRSRRELAGPQGSSS